MTGQLSGAWKCFLNIPTWSRTHWKSCKGVPLTWQARNVWKFVTSAISKVPQNFSRQSAMYHAKTAIAIWFLLFLACGSRSREPSFLVFPEIDRLSKVWSEKCCRAEYQYFGFLLGQFEAANLSVFNNNWSSIFDFTPAAGETTWILLPEVCERSCGADFSERKYTKIPTTSEIHVRARNWEITQREGSAESHLFSQIRFRACILPAYRNFRLFAWGFAVCQSLVPRVSSVFNMVGSRCKIPGALDVGGSVAEWLGYRVGN